MAAVGSATAHRMRAEGFPPAIVPDDFRAEGLVAAFQELGAEKCRRVLIPRAEEAREVLPEALRAMGCDVDVVVVYRTVPAAPDPAIIDAAARAAPSTSARSRRERSQPRSSTRSQSAGLDAGEVMRGMVVASIGPITTEALRQLGFEVDVEAAESTMGALVDAIVRTSRVTSLTDPPPSSVAGVHVAARSARVSLECLWRGSFD